MARQECGANAFSIASRMKPMRDSDRSQRHLFIDNTNSFHYNKVMPGWRNR